MEIILKEDVIGLGYKNDIVTVKNGYGRNYLLPQGKAVIASASAKKVLAENLRQRAHRLAKIKADAQELADKLAKVEALVIPIGASGCRILITLIYEMMKRDSKYGLATLCIGGGMGTALVVER